MHGLEIGVLGRLGCIKGLMRVFPGFGHIKRMENSKIVNRVYKGECMGCCLVDLPQKVGSFH